MKKTFLVLSDGTVFDGLSFGAVGECVGEVVFNTSITGYQEILTDPSYKGQIVAMTYPLIGNYGVNMVDIESKDGPKVEGFIVKEFIGYPSNWRSKGSLGYYLSEHNIVGIQAIDTRALVRHLRDRGSQMGIISSVEPDPIALHQRIKDHKGIGDIDLIDTVTVRDGYEWDEGLWHSWDSEPSNLTPYHVIVYDYGVKYNILRHLKKSGFKITVVPANTPAEAILERDPDGIFLSNGPGNPETIEYGIENVRKLIGKKPIFGICMGHQILGLALGGRAYKLKFGHHGGNHPVMELSTKKIEITSQNHNYYIDTRGMGGEVVQTHINLYDNTDEGMRHKELPIFSVQYHPEASPGPNDSNHLFTRFREMIQGS